MQKVRNIAMYATALRACEAHRYQKHVGAAILSIILASICRKASCRYESANILCCVRIDKQCLFSSETKTVLGDLWFMKIPNVWKFPAKHEFSEMKTEYRYLERPKMWSECWWTLSARSQVSARYPRAVVEIHRAVIKPGH